MEIEDQMNEEKFYQLKKLPIINQRDSVRLFVAQNGDQYIMKLLKKQEGKSKDQRNNQREIDIALKLIDAVSPSKYIVVNYKAYETDKYYFLKMEKCDGSLIDLFGQDDINNLDSQVRIKLIIELFYQIIQGYKYIKSIFPEFMHRDLCLDNIFYKKIDGQYIAKIADYGVIKLYQGTLTFDFNKKRQYMPPEAQKEKGTGSYDDKLDVYTLGVCLYKMLFGLTSQVQFNEGKLDLPNESKDESYCRFLSLINQMLQYENKNRMCWKELYSLLYQFPQILATRGIDDGQVTDCYNYLTERLEQQQLGQLLDNQMKQVAISFKLLLRNLGLTGQQQIMIITTMKYTFQQHLKQLKNLSEEQFDQSILKIRSARYIAILAGQIESNFIQKDNKFQELLFDKDKQILILKSIRKPKNLKPYFKSFIRNKLNKSTCNIF